MKPLTVWTAFAVGLAVVVAAMVAGTSTALDVERSEREARALAALEENTRLALWRIDSALMPIVAEEASRPVLDYTALRPAGGRVLVRLEIGPTGAVSTSPADAARLAELRRIVPEPELLRDAARPLPPAAPVAPAANLPAQKMKGAREFQARQESFYSNVAKMPPAVAVPRSAESGVFAPVWLNGELLLVRAVRVGGAALVQAAWLDWPALDGELRASVQDLLPDARLLPAETAVASDEERRLVTLPVRLDPGRAAVDPRAPRSPVRLSLVAAWALLLVAAGSVAALLAGVLALSERRRVFVSAVTHELRTPLTTFRLYTDMLTLGMVTGEEKKAEYLEKLSAEARRLAHLVENVLFYARLDGGRVGAVREDVEVGAFLDELGPRLGERAARVALELAVTTGGAPMVAHVDRSALEQVLVNLVDNACRYAVGSRPPLIRLTLGRIDGRVVLRVRDHGPGLTPADRKRLFRPFSKSDREAADSAPGVGLGLALSRRLMRAQGGDLQVDAAVTDGAGFVVVLPAGSASPP